MSLGFKANETHSALSEELFPDRTVSIDAARRVLSQLPESVFVFDEFDRLPAGEARKFTDLMKTLSDLDIDSTLVLVGVSGTIDELLADHASVSRCVLQVRMPRMQPDELRAILTTGEKRLGMWFETSAANRIVRMSQGLPHYTHLTGLHAVRAACDRGSKLVESSDVAQAFKQAVRTTHQSIISKFTEAIRCAQKDALYSHVLLACAVTASRSVDALGYFTSSRVLEPLKEILPGKALQIASYSKHLGEFCEEKRGCVLERTGQQRNYRYRFSDPLLPSYVIINGIASGLLDQSVADRLVKATQEEAGVSNGQLPLF